MLWTVESLCYSIEFKSLSTGLQRMPSDYLVYHVKTFACLFLKDVVVTYIFISTGFMKPSGKHTML